jgi:hypothetical protein
MMVTMYAELWIGKKQLEIISGTNPVGKDEEKT